MPQWREVCILFEELYDGDNNVFFACEASAMDEKGDKQTVLKESLKPLKVEELNGYKRGTGETNAEKSRVY